MEILPIASISHTVEKPKRHGKQRKEYFRLYYTKNKPKYLQTKQKHRQKQKLNKPPKPQSLFLQKRQQNFISCLDKHHITVAIPRSLKTKHPIVKG